MGLFDFFKKKNTEETTNSAPRQSTLFSQISRYNEYIVRFITMQQQGNYAPIAAYEKPNGEITGFLYLMAEGDSYTLSAGEVIGKMEQTFEAWLNTGEIKSYTIFYHSQFDNDNNHQIANKDQELKAITIAYHFKNEAAGKIGLPYFFENEQVAYHTISVFSEQENNIIFNTPLKQGFNYFQHTERITAPETQNSIGLKIKKSNNYDLSNMWCGIFGFNSYRQPEGSKVLEECFALALTRGQNHTKGQITVSSLHFADVSFNAIQLNGKAKTIEPVIKTNYIVDVEHKEINEWENVDNLEAIISGSGRETFGISYFATDYAVNRELYLSQKKHQVKLSGIVFVLDVYKKKSIDDLPLADDFAAYIPNKDLPNYGCFDFIGLLEDFKETTLLPGNNLKGYILNVRLINNPDVKDFFTIDMFVTPENMRFTELTKGMKLTGMFQLQGQLA
jgi:hypothetical protein